MLLEVAHTELNIACFFLLLLDVTYTSKHTNMNVCMFVYVIFFSCTCKKMLPHKCIFVIYLMHVHI